MSRHWTILYTLQTINPLNSLSLSFFLQCFGRPLSISRNSCSMCWILEAIIFLFYFYLCSAPSALAFPLWSWRFYLTIHFLPGCPSTGLIFLFPFAEASIPPPVGQGDYLFSFRSLSYIPLLGYRVSAREELLNIWVHWPSMHLSLLILLCIYSYYM